MAAPTPLADPLVRGALPSEALVEGMRRWFWLEAKDPENLIPKVFNVHTSQKAQEFDYSMTTIGLFVEKGPLQPFEYEQIGKGYKSTYTHVTYGKGVRTEKEAIDDEQYGLLEKRSRLLANSWKRTRARHLVTWLEAGFTSVWNTTEGQYLFDTDHPLDPRAATPPSPHSAGYGVNKITGGLSIDNLQTAIEMLQTTPDAMGEPMDMKAKYLLVPPALQFLAAQILKSAGEYDSPNNTINTIANAMQIIIVPRLSSATNWYVLADQHELHWFDREPLNTTEKYEDDPGLYRQTARGRYSYGASDWRGIIGGYGA